MLSGEGGGACAGALPVGEGGTGEGGREVWAGAWGWGGGGGACAAHPPSLQRRMPLHKVPPPAVGGHRDGACRARVRGRPGGQRNDHARARCRRRGQGNSHSNSKKCTHRIARCAQEARGGQGSNRDSQNYRREVRAQEAGWAGAQPHGCPTKRKLHRQVAASVGDGSTAGGKERRGGGGSRRRGDLRTACSRLCHAPPSPPPRPFGIGGRGDKDAVTHPAATPARRSDR